MDKSKKNMYLYIGIGAAVVVAIIVGVAIALSHGGGGNGSEGGGGSSSSARVTAAELSSVNTTIDFGDFDGMTTLSKDIQNGYATGKIVKIDGTVSHPMSTYSIVQSNSAGTSKIGTQFIIDGDNATYPSDGAHVVITGKVIEKDPLLFLIVTLPEYVEVKD